MKSLFAGLDLGTSCVKAGLYDLEGRELGVAYETLSIQYPAEDQAEQDPKEWRRAVLKSLHDLLQLVVDGRVVGVGLSGQCPGHVLVDAGGEPLGPAIIWRDRRAKEEAAWLAENVSPEDGLRWTGCDFLGDPTMSPARLVWLRRYRPEDWQRAAWILQPKDYVGLLLTGCAATDANTAFMLAHPQSHAYHPDYLRLLGIEERQMPPVQPPTSLLGRVTGQAAALTGLPEGTPVFTGTIDAYCETLAGGAFLPGQAVDAAGTSEIVSLGVAGEQQGGGVFLAKVEGEGSFLCGPMQAGGGLQNWLASAFYPDMGGTVNPQRMEMEAAGSPPGAGGLVFLPYLHGERAPIWDPAASGAFVGLSVGHDRRHFTRAVYEGVAFAVRHVLEVCEQVSGLHAAQVVTCGGASRSRFWNEIKANVLQRPLLPLQARASACLGAAMLAAVGAGEFENLAQAWTSMSRTGEAVLPVGGLADVYEQRYGEYRRAYPAMKSIFKEGRRVE